jgi:hypothetical protein
MSYSQFTLRSAIASFNLTLVEGRGLFTSINPVSLSDFLQQQLDFGLPLAVAVGTEKARSEFIIAPVLGELKRNTGWSLFSGVEFDTDNSLGINGWSVDFLMSANLEQSLIKSPVILVIETAKNDISSGLGQCAATMVAAQLFNESTQVIRGAVTTGTVWRFLELRGDRLAIDLAEVTDFGIVLGFLANLEQR